MEEPVLEEREADEGHDGTREQGAAMNVNNATSRQATTLLWVWFQMYETFCHFNASLTLNCRLRCQL